MDSICYILIVQHISDELAASVRLITGRETTTEHQNVTLIDILLHHGD